jgi:hypothetical protein
VSISVIPAFGHEAEKWLLLLPLLLLAGVLAAAARLYERIRRQNHGIGLASDGIVQAMNGSGLGTALHAIYSRSAAAARRRGARAAARAACVRGASSRTDVQ